MKYNVVTVDGEVVCQNCTHHEALLCIAELVKLDKIDNVYTPHYYKIKEVAK